MIRSRPSRIVFPVHTQIPPVVHGDLSAVSMLVMNEMTNLQMRLGKYNV